MKNEYMAYYQVEIKWSDPYPKNKSYRTIGSSIGLGAYRALKQFRKENRGRRIKNISLNLIQYATEKAL